MRRARSNAGRSDDPLTGATRGLEGVIVPFFLVHYGMFWVVHGIFVFALPLFLGISSIASRWRRPSDDRRTASR